MRQDDAPVVQGLLRRGFDPNTPSPDGATGLYMALREPSLRVAEVLAAWPATNIETRTTQDESPLMMAALKGHLELAKRLVDRGADVNKPGWAPLHYAATGGHVALMRLLLEHYAFIDAESPNGTTPLMMAAMYGSPEAVRLLLDEGADWAMKNQQGLTALDFARRGNRADAEALLEARATGTAVVRELAPALPAADAVRVQPAQDAGAVPPAPLAPRATAQPQESAPGASGDPQPMVQPATREPGRW